MIHVKTRHVKHSVPKKPEKVSCEEPHKFLKFANILFSITVTQKSGKSVVQDGTARQNREKLNKKSGDKKQVKYRSNCEEINRTGQTVQIQIQITPSFQSFTSRKRIFTRTAI